MKKKKRKNQLPSLLGADGLPLSRKPPKHPAPLRSKADPIRERYVDTDNGHRIVTTQTCDDTIAAVHAAREIIPKKQKNAPRYKGSVPLVVCQIWAKQCGAPIGSREFSEYAAKQLDGGEYAKFKAWLA